MPSATTCPSSQAASTFSGVRFSTMRRMAYTPSTPANRKAEKCERIASHKKPPDASIARAEFACSARSRKYADPIANASSSAYCRTSVERSIEEGRNTINANAIQTTLCSNKRDNQRYANQQNAVPARMEGRRSMSSEVPSPRQTRSKKISSGGCDTFRLERYVSHHVVLLATKK